MYTGSGPASKLEMGEKSDTVKGGLCGGSMAWADGCEEVVST